MTGEDISNGCRVIIDGTQAPTGVPASFALDVVFLVVVVHLCCSDEQAPTGGPALYALDVVFLLVVVDVNAGFRRECGISRFDSWKMW